jgi:ADP-ribosylglycohydrolase
MIAAARAQTALTHNNRTIIETAEFFGRVVWQVLHGEAPTAAIKQVLVEGFYREPYANWVTDGLNSVEADTRQAILDFGQMCEIEAAFPCVVHLIARYEDNLAEGLTENAMAGGDSASRGLIVGMILGAHRGIDAIPQKWLSDLKSYQEIIDLMDQIDRKLD